MSDEFKSERVLDLSKSLAELEDELWCRGEVLSVKRVAGNGLVATKAVAVSED